MTLLHEGGEMLLLEGEPGPVAAASAFRAGLYCYEVQIPLQSPGADAWTMKGKPGEEVHVCLELGGVSSETEEAGGEGEVPGERTRGDGGMRPGGGMGPGGMPPGGRGGGRGGAGGDGRSARHGSRCHGHDASDGAVVYDPPG